MDIRNPKPEELDDLISQISLAFQYKPSEAGVARDFPQFYHPDNRQNLWVATENDRILGHSGLYLAEMKVDHIVIPVAAIGGVFSQPEVQGQGVASQLVNKCIQEAKKKGAALAFLWSDKEDFYQKMGFFLLGRQWTIHLDPAHLLSTLKKHSEGTGFKEEDLGFEQNRRDSVFLSQSFQFIKDSPLGIARSAEEHALLLSSESCQIFSAWLGETLVAYFVLGKGKDLQNYIHEWAGEPGALSLLAKHCLETFNHPLFLLSPQFMPEEVSWIYSLEEMGATMRPEKMALVKLLDLERIEKLLNAHLARIGISNSDFQIFLENGKYSAVWKGTTRFEFDEAGFLRFMFGPDMPTEPALRAFLPMRLWYWGMDSV